MPDGPEDGLSPGVRDFLVAYVDSVELLEVLVMLARQPEVAFSHQRVAANLRSAVHSVKNRLRRLTEHSLVERLENDTFRLSASPELTRVLAEVARTYAERPVAVVRQIHSRPSDLVRVFSEEFKRKKGAKDS